MNQSVPEAINILMLRSRIPKPFNLIVSGVSMLPVLQAGDIISVCRQDIYEIGDILVFVYKNNDLLVHRLLKIEKDRYFCKGDNSFRLEDVSANQIIGAVQLSNDPHDTVEFVNDSYQINRIFRSNKYDILATKQTPEYHRYHKKYLE